MGLQWMVILLLKMTVTGLNYGIVEGDSTSSKKIFDVQNAVKTIQSEDGDIFDCVDIYKQPALDHPALKNHIIQMTPSDDPTMETSTKGSTERNEDSSLTVTSQLWHKNGSCPKGTIPIRRISKKFSKSNSTNFFGRKKPGLFPHVEQSNDNATTNVQQANHSLAILLTEGFAYTGGKGDIKTYTPFVETDDEYSTSQVALQSGPYYDYESVESGWAVNPSVYGDHSTRLFVYWTVDASKTTGCFDLTCPGFVQVSNEIALGAAIYPISSPTGLPYQIIIFIFKDPNTGNWWVQYGERINIGYWPADLFGNLKGHAETVQWGGEVYSSRVGIHPHTATAMGSGNYPDYIDQTSGCVKRMRVRENSVELKFPEFVFAYSDEYDCYDVFYLGDYIEDPEFYYGGPGQNYKCP